MWLRAATKGQVFDPGLTDVHSEQQIKPGPMKNKYTERGYYFVDNHLEKRLLCHPS